jgi:MFS family permease
MSTKTSSKGRRGNVDRGKRASAAPAAERLPAALPTSAAAALVFVAAGAVLVLEILAVRLLAPYVGLTLETTTSIIGAALGGIAAGAAIGGYLADRTDTRRLIVVLLLLGGALTLLTVPAVRWLGPGARGEGEFAALGIMLVSLVPAAAVLSAVSPAVAHLQLHDLRASGTVVGRLSAWATAGALVGTFGTGFVLVPLMPVSTAVLVIGAVIVFAGVALGAGSRLLSLAGVAGVAVVAVALGAASTALHSPCLAETHYNCIGIVAEAAHPEGYNLLLDDGYESFIDPQHPSRLEYAYTQWIADAIDGMNRPKAPLDGVFVGGGGLTLPRWLDATRPGSHALVLEVDGGLINFVENRLKLPPPSQFQVKVGDARINMLEVKSNSADVVVGDAFSQHSVPWQLTTSEWIAEVKRVLKPGGLYAMNLIDDPPLEMLKAEAATLLNAFSDVRLVTFAAEDGRPAGGNAVLLASDRPMPKAVRSNAEGAITYNLPGVEWLARGAEPLRDDYAPVDQLLTRTN